MADPVDAEQYGVDLALADPVDEKVYDPPKPVTFNLTIEHTGDALTEEVAIEVLDEPGGWDHHLTVQATSGSSSSMDVLIFELEQGEVASLNCTIVPTSGMVMGTYWLTVRAYVTAQNTTADAVAVGVTIVQEVDFDIMVENEPPGGFKVQPPATVTIQFAIYNLGDRDDRFHVSVGSSLSSAGWIPVIESGVDGLGWTPVLPSDPGRDTPHIVVVKVDVSEIEFAGTICTITANATSEADPSKERAPASTVIKVLQFYAFSVKIIGPAQKEGTVGGTVEFQFEIHNEGNGVDNFRIFAAWNEDDAPGWSARPDPPEVLINPQTSSTLDYIVKLPDDATLGTYTFHAEIWSADPELTSTSRTFRVSVAEHYAMVVWTARAERDVDPGESVHFTVKVRNRGNTIDSYTLSWAWRDGNWITYLRPESLTLFPDESGDVNVTFLVPDDLGNDPLPTYTFDLRVESVGGDAVELLSLLVHMRSFGRVEWTWEGGTVTSPDEPVAAPGTLRPKVVIDVYNGTTAAISVILCSNGIIDDNVTLWAMSDDDRITVTVLPEWRVVHAGEDLEVFVQISVPDYMLPGEHRVWVNVTSSDRREAMRAVPVEFDVIPYYDTEDFRDLVWNDLWEDEFAYTYSIEGTDVVSSRGRRGGFPEFDVISLTAIIDPETNIVTVMMDLKGAPVSGPGVFYAVYFVNPDHRVEGGLLDPESHRRGDFVWESHDEANTTAHMYLSDQQMGSSVPMPSLDIEFQYHQITFTMHAKDLRMAGVDPGSGLNLYAYCHRLGSSEGDDSETRLIYDSAGQGAVEVPKEFTREPGISSSMVWIGVAVAVVAVLAILFLILLPKLRPPEPEPAPEPEPVEVDEWVEYG